MKTYQFPLPTGHPGTLQVPDDTPPKVTAGIMFGFHGFGILRQASKASVGQMLDAMAEDSAGATPENMQFAMLLMAALEGAKRIDSVSTDAELESLLVDMTTAAKLSVERVKELRAMADKLKAEDQAEGPDPCPASAGI